MRNSSGAFAFLYTLNLKSMKLFYKNSANAIILDVLYKIHARARARALSLSLSLYIYTYIYIYIYIYIRLFSRLSKRLVVCHAELLCSDGQLFLQP